MSFKKIGEFTIDETPVSNSNNLITSNAVAQLSNPNLLINGDFRVNQRGQTTYTSGYTVDRWSITSGASVAVNNDGTITIVNNTSSNKWFQQSLEDKDKNKLINTNITMSVMIEEITGSVYLYTGGANKTVNTAGLQTLNYYIPSTGFGGVTGIRINPNSSVKVRYIKLEIGEFATPFVQRPYAEELAICQRYYYRVSIFNRNWFRFGISGCVSEDKIATVNFYNNFRTTPTVSYGGNIRIFTWANNTVTHPMTGLTVDACSTNTVSFKATTDDTLVRGAYAELASQGDNNSWIALDAEVY